MDHGADPAGIGSTGGQHHARASEQSCTSRCRLAGAPAHPSVRPAPTLCCAARIPRSRYSATVVHHQLIRRTSEQGEARGDPSRVRLAQCTRRAARPDVNWCVGSSGYTVAPHRTFRQSIWCRELGLTSFRVTLGAVLLKYCGRDGMRHVSPPFSSVSSDLPSLAPAVPVPHTPSHPLAAATSDVGGGGGLGGGGMGGGGGGSGGGGGLGGSGGGFPLQRATVLFALAVAGEPRVEAPSTCQELRDRSHSCHCHWHYELASGHSHSKL